MRNRKLSVVNLFRFFATSHFALNDTLKEIKMNDKEINPKKSWRDSYTWVLLANAGYILVFYFLMKIFG